jgi:hypothetical protein
MPRGRGLPDPTTYIDERFKDLDAENALLREELRKALSLPEPEWRKSPAVFKRKSGKFRKHFVIPDTQVKPGVPTEHLNWAGRYIAEKAEPGDAVVHLGDHWDMPSLSSYDKGKRSFEGRRYKLDIASGNAALELLSAEIDGLKLERHILRGNHEDRISRLIESEPWLEGVVTMDDMRSPGWTVHPFLSVLDLDGVLYSHYFYTPTTGRPRSGMAANILRHVGRSFVMGHRQVHDVAMMELPDGSRRRGVVSGAFYQHSEDYLGPQSSHWRGMLMLTEVQGGDFDIVEVSLDYLRRKYR